MTTQPQQAPATIIEGDMLKTSVPERAMSVSTSLHTGRDHVRGCPPRRCVRSGPRDGVRWLHFRRGPTTPGGLQEAHEAVVQQVQAGTLPQEDH